MIFGFNTDIKHEGTVYHVQSEAREHDKLLQTQVFVRGRCVGKHANSYAAQMAQPGFSDERMHDLLKTQHKSVIDAIRSGSLDKMLAPPTAPAPPAAAETSSPPEAAALPPEITPPMDAALEAAMPPVDIVPPTVGALKAAAPPVEAPPALAAEIAEVAAAPATQNNKLVVQWINAGKIYEDSTVVMKFSVTQHGSVVAGAQVTTRLEVPQENPIYTQTTTGEDGSAEIHIFLDEDALNDAAVLVQVMHDGHRSTRKFRLHKQ